MTRPSSEMLVGGRERPILFSAPMVRAILAGTKTQTRRIVKPQPYSMWGHGVPLPHIDKQRRFGVHAAFNVSEMRVDRWLPCLYGAPGDRLWVRETWAAQHAFDAFKPSEINWDARWHYAATEPRGGLLWRPSIHMPRCASRITLDVTGVRVERLHSISEVDAQAEGVEMGSAFRKLYPSKDAAVAEDRSYRVGFNQIWHEINGRESWNANPWVWVIEFRKVETTHPNHLREGRG